jgi:DNA-binding GntR family transcriptional regulator
MSSAIAKPKPYRKGREKEKEGEVERVYRQLLEWLVTAQLRPGEFLSELDLAARCNTSRTPVREACSRLAQDRWLSLIRRKGWMVTPISVRDIIEMYEYRRLLECFTAEQVAQSATREQVDELKEIVSSEHRDGSTLAEILKANERFHLRLAELAGNKLVFGEISLTLSYFRRLDTLCTQTVPGWIGHDEIIGAIASHRHEEARKAMALHIASTSDKMIKLFSS